MVNRRRAVGAIGVVVALFGVAACSSSTNATKPLAKGATTTSTQRVSQRTTSSAAPPPTCTASVTSDPYDGFHIGVPDGWNLFTLDGTIVVSKDATGTEQEQAALTLGEDLEVNRSLVEARVAVLELPQRRPLRFADGLARRLDAELVRHWSRRRSSAPFPGCAGFLRIRPK